MLVQLIKPYTRIRIPFVSEGMVPEAVIAPPAEKHFEVMRDLLQELSSLPPWVRGQPQTSILS